MTPACADDGRWPGPQRRIGLTGGIASGKSSVGRLLATRGLPLLDADVYAREALAPGTAASRAVLARYGAAVLARPDAAAAALPTNDQPTPASASSSNSRADPTATIDRAALGRIVFADPAERRWLEQLVHPLVRQRFAAEFARLVAEPAVVLVIPLLFEVGLEELCGEVWLVDCDEAQQLQRLMQRDRLKEAEARARLAAQWPLARKRDLAEVLIDNRGAPDALAPQVEAALRRRPVPDGLDQTETTPQR